MTRQTVYRCPPNHAVTNGVRGLDERHERAPHAILFHSRAACLEAIRAWVVFLAAADPLAPGTGHHSPVSILDGEQRFPGYREGHVSYHWRVEVVAVESDENSVWVSWRGWFHPHQERQVQTFTADGTPAGWAKAQTPIGEWYPFRQADWNRPTIEGEPDIVRTYTVEPEEVVLLWGDEPEVIP